MSIVRDAYGPDTRRTYTPAEQARYSAQYPGLVWINGKPYTRSQGGQQSPEELAAQYGPNPQYWPPQDTGGLVEADLRKTTGLGSALGELAAVTSAGQALAGPQGIFAGASGGGSAAAPVASSAAPTASTAAAAPTLSGVAPAGTLPASMTGPGAVSTFASSAPAASAVAPAAAGGGWASWISRLAPVATTAAGIVQGVQNSKAIDKANQEQKAATQAAMQIQQQAQQRAGDVYQQQRADTANLFGGPYSTLGSLMGFNIAPIGPANGRIPTSAQPAGVPAALATNVPMQAPYPGSPSNGQPLQGAPIGLWQNGPSGVPAATTLRALADVASRSKSSSSYSDGTAKRR